MLGILRKLSPDELATIQELTKTHDQSKRELAAAQRKADEDQTLVNAWIISIKRKYDLQDTDHIRVDSGDIVRDAAIPSTENG